MLTQRNIYLIEQTTGLTVGAEETRAYTAEEMNHLLEAARRAGKEEWAGQSGSLQRAVGS